MRLITTFVAVLALVAGTVSATAEEYDNSTTYSEYEGVGEGFELPKDALRMPMPPLEEGYVPNTFSRPLSAEAKMQAVQAMMLMNPFSLRQIINMMVAKKKVDEGISFDEVIESMDSRANSLNFRKVGHNTPYTIIEETLQAPTPRIEIIQYCDVITMRTILDYVPEFSAFVPCRVTVMEDAHGDIWITTLDWDVRWLDASQNPNKISTELRDAAIYIREGMESIMDAGATGDF